MKVNDLRWSEGFIAWRKRTFAASWVVVGSLFVGAFLRLSSLPPDIVGSRLPAASHDGALALMLVLLGSASYAAWSLQGHLPETYLCRTARTVTRSYLSDLDDFDAALARKARARSVATSLAMALVLVLPAILSAYGSIFLDSVAVGAVVPMARTIHYMRGSALALLKAHVRAHSKAFGTNPLT